MAQRKENKNWYYVLQNEVHSHVQFSFVSMQISRVTEDLENLSIQRTLGFIILTNSYFTVHVRETHYERGKNLQLSKGYLKVPFLKNT